MMNESSCRFDRPLSFAAPATKGPQPSYWMSRNCSRDDTTGSSIEWRRDGRRIIGRRRWLVDVERDSVDLEFRQGTYLVLLFTQGDET